MSEYLFRTENLIKSFGKTEVLHGITMSINRGEVYGLIGENGAGKTTLMRLMTGLMKPTKGTVLFGSTCPCIGYMPQSCRFDGNLSALDTIRFFSGIRKSGKKDIEFRDMADKLKLDLKKKVRHLSPGQQKKLQMMIAMTGDPELLVLDEPTAGLDPSASYEMKRMIEHLHSQGKSILISSHILQDMDDICTNIAIMDHGNLTYDKVIESNYVVMTTPVPNQILKEISKQFMITADESATNFTARIHKEEVPVLIDLLICNGISIYGVTCSNIQEIVKKQLQIEKRCQYEG